MLVLVAIALLGSACATPIGVVRGSTQEMHYALTANVLSAGEPSSWSTQVLHRTNLWERFRVDPAAVLADLRKTLAQPLSEDRLQARLFALSELSFLHAERTGGASYYLASAVYAYAFLFPEAKKPLDPLDPRVRLAADLYNRGLTKGLESPDGEQVVLGARTIPPPFGELALTTIRAGFSGGISFQSVHPGGRARGAWV